MICPRCGARAVRYPTAGHAWSGFARCTAGRASDVEACGMVFPVDGLALVPDDRPPEPEQGTLAL